MDITLLLKPLHHCVEHSVTSELREMKDDNVAVKAASRVRKIVEGYVRDHQVDVEQLALGLICAEREELWSRCRRLDATGSGNLSKPAICEVLDEVCGHIGWMDLLERMTPGPGNQVPYRHLLSSPKVRWFHMGSSDVVSLARATVQAELKLSTLAALFDKPEGGLVTPILAREALRLLLPSMQDHQRHQLATVLFGDQAVELSAVLHQLMLFADPPTLTEAWMRPALQCLANLVEEYHGPAPLHCALIRFFKSIDRDGTDLLRPSEFVHGFRQLGAYDASGEDQVPRLHSGRLQRLFEVIDKNSTGTISFLELLLALDERTERPQLPEFRALEGWVPALLFVNKGAVLNNCHALDPLDKGCISTKNFLELVATLAQVAGRPLSNTVRTALATELKEEEIAYAEVLHSFEVSVGDGPWQCGPTGKIFSKSGTLLA